MYNSGKYGFLLLDQATSQDPHLIIHDYAINFGHNDVVIYHANSNNAPERVCGEGRGNFSFSSPTLYFFGDKFFKNYHQFKVYLHPYTVYGANGLGTTFAGRINSITGMWSWATGGTLSYRTNLDILSDSLTFTTTAFREDYVVCLSSQKNRKVEERRNVDEDSEFSELQYLQQATFTLTNAAPTINHARLKNLVNTYSGDFNVHGTIDCRISLRFDSTMYTDSEGYSYASLMNKYINRDFVELTQRNSHTFSYRFWINEDEYWEFNNLLPLEIRDLEVNRVTGQIVRCTIDLGMTAIGLYGGSGSGESFVSPTSIYSPFDVQEYPFVLASNILEEIL